MESSNVPSSFPAACTRLAAQEASCFECHKQTKFAYDIQTNKCSYKPRLLCRTRSRLLGLFKAASVLVSVFWNQDLTGPDLLYSQGSWKEKKSIQLHYCFKQETVWWPKKIMSKFQLQNQDWLKHLLYITELFYYLQHTTIPMPFVIHTILYQNI